MAWRKSPPALLALFDRSLPATDGVERRTMFGCPAAFANGQMFALLHQESFVLRLSEADRRLMRERHGAKAFEPVPGRPKREYFMLPEAVIEDPTLLASWLNRSIAYASTVTPKPPKPALRRKAAQA
jgi:TfoX/Sxy family transcriptional regulator of competence genes